MTQAHAWLHHLTDLNDTALVEELKATRDSITFEVMDKWRAEIEDVKYDRPSQALAMAEVILKAAQVSGKDDCRALALWVKSHALMMQARFKEGLQFCDEAASIFDGLGQHGNALRVQVSKVFAVAKLSEESWQAAVDLADALRPELERNDDRESLARLDMTVGMVLHWLDRFELALQAYERSYRIWSALGNELQCARTRINQGVSLESMGSLEEALQAYEEGRRVALDAAKMTTAARANLNLGCLHRLQGNYTQALKCFAEAHEGFAKDNIEVEMAECRLYEAMLLLDLNRLGEVIWRCEEIEPIFEREDIVEDLMLSNLLLARAYARRGWAGDWRKAEKRLRECRNQLLARGAVASAAWVSLHLADSLRGTDQSDEALPIAIGAIEIFDRYGQPIERAWAQLSAAQSYLKLQRYTEAEALLHESLHLAAERKMPQLTFRCHHALGLLAKARGDLETAWLEHRRAIRTVDELRMRLPADDDLRSDFFEDKLDVYRSAVMVCLDRDRETWDELFALIEQAKSRTLLDMLQRAQIMVKPDLADREAAELFQRLQDLTQQWQEKRGKQGYDVLAASDIAQDPLRSGDAADRDDIDLQYRILELQRKLNLRSPHRGVFQGETTSDLREVQAHLPAETALLEYFLAGSRWVVLVVDNENCTCHCLTTDVEKLDDLCKQFDRSIEKHYVDPQFWQSLVFRDLNVLHSVLIEPLKDRLMGMKRLVFIPDANLHHLPFHALHDGTAFLIERFEVSYAPSATVLVQCLKRPESVSGQSVLFGFSDETGERIPQAVEEVQRIAGILPDAILYLEQDARKDALLALTDPLMVLHVATHGTVCYDSPLFSSLAFADGELTVREVYNLRLPSSLVSLSACMTGRGVQKGTHMVGLASAFLCAGAQALVTALWKISDEPTSELMRRMYYHLLQGASRSAALRYAQLELMRRDAYRHPYYWAPFVLSGDYRAWGE